MKEKMLVNIIQTILLVIDEEMIESFADTVLDFFEVKAYELGGWKKTVILTSCRTLRATFGWEDDDDIN